MIVFTDLSVSEKEVSPVRIEAVFLCLWLSEHLSLALMFWLTLTESGVVFLHRFCCSGIPGFWKFFVVTQGAWKLWSKIETKLLWQTRRLQWQSRFIPPNCKIATPALCCVHMCRWNIDNLETSCSWGSWEDDVGVRFTQPVAIPETQMWKPLLLNSIPDYPPEIPGSQTNTDWWSVVHDLFL